MTSYRIPEDEIIVDGKNVIMYSRPPLPYGDPRIKAISIVRDDDIVEDDYLEVSSSPPSRRHYDWAGWEIRDKTLLLTHIGYGVMSAPIIADWYSGLVVTESAEQPDRRGPKIRKFRLVNGCVRKVVERYLFERRPTWAVVPGFDNYLDEEDLLGDSDSLTFEELCKGIKQLIDTLIRIDQSIGGTDSAQTIKLLICVQEAIVVCEGLFRSGLIAEAREKLILDEALFGVAYESYWGRLKDRNRFSAGLLHREPYRRKMIVAPMNCVGCRTTIPKTEYEKYGGDCIVCHFKKAHR